MVILKHEDIVSQNCTGKDTTLKALQEQLLKEKPYLTKGERQAIQALHRPRRPQHEKRYNVERDTGMESKG
jgi:hypothetical protein